MTEGVEIMTDFQFKSLIGMVMEILDRSTDLEDAKRALAKFAGDNVGEEKRTGTEKAASDDDS
jgi:hypothetical protein